MYNEFEVVQCRFHMKKKNTLIIKGYFEEGSKKHNSLRVLLDHEELQVSINEEINQGRHNTNKQRNACAIPRTHKDIAP